MSCIYGPYQVTTSLPSIGQFSFVDSSLSRRVVVFVDCDSTATPPCPGAVALHIEDGCPDTCKTVWYECPSENGRRYTLFSTPCGVTITSFEDGLTKVDGCDATQFGTEHFCFGKVYTELGEFETAEKTSTNFEFDGHSFSVKGQLGECNELFTCEECGLSENQVVAFEELPTPPDDPSAPSLVSDEEEPSSEDVPVTSVVPSEDRVIWTRPSTMTEFRAGTFCEPERTLASWSHGQSPGSCGSNDHPSIATLPSGHTIIAYENRAEDGSTKISVAILSSSVGQNIRYHRKLGTGTLLNDFGAGATATFEVFDDMVLSTDEDGVPPSGTKIGFLTGPLEGQLIDVSTVARSRLSNNRIKHTFTFPVGVGVEFPDKNHVYDVKWFLADTEGSSDLPNSESIETIIDMPHYDDEGNQAPVANPSVAIAQNNVMAAHEQNVYIAYQAFENSEWRVYLRELVLGGDESSPPTYLSPYLFDENVRQIRVMAVERTTSVMAAGHVFYSEDFGSPGVNLGADIDDLPGWQSVTSSGMVAWKYDTGLLIADYPTEPFRLCKTGNWSINRNFPDCQSGSQYSTCAAVYNSSSIGCNDIGIWDGWSEARSFALNDTPTTLSDGNALNLTFSMRLNIKNQSSQLNISPEIWFIIGQDSASVLTGEGFRLQIRRAGAFDSQVSPRASEVVISCDQGGCNSCFITSLYTAKSPLPEGTGITWSDRRFSTGSQTDRPTRVQFYCVESPSFDYTKGDGWDNIVVETYTSGSYRHFDVTLTNAAGSTMELAAFREWDETTPDIFTPNYTKRDLGPYHGFGVVTAAPYRSQVAIDNFEVKQRTSHVDDRGQLIFLEDYITRPESFNDFPATLNRWNPFLLNLSTSPSSQTHDYSLIYFCGGSGGGTAVEGMAWYPTRQGWLLVYPHVEDHYARLEGCGANLPVSGSWSVVYSAVPSTDFGTNYSDESTASYLDISAVLSINRWRNLPVDAWPQVWFCLRRQSFLSSWHSSWRVRIFYFEAKNDYPGISPLSPSVDVFSGDKVWWVQLYDGVSDAGGIADIPLDEQFIINSSIEWVEQDNERPTWNFFKTDIQDIDGDTVVTVWVGDSSDITSDNEPTVNMQVVDNSFQQLCQFTVPRVAANNGAFHGFAVFSGLESEPELADDDYRSTVMINHVRLSTITAPVPEFGACCRAVGGCDDDQLEANCQSPDIFHQSATCADVAADCEIAFPTGATCTALGVCIDDITLAAAVQQGIEGAWLETKNCIPNDPNELVCVATTTGSCCRSFYSGGSPQCIDDVTLAECQTYYGNTPVPPGYWRIGISCGTNCPSITGGACCLPSGCEVKTEAKCSGAQGTWQGNQTDCISDPCVAIGACCDGVGGCTEETEDDCDLVPGTWLGLGTDCTPDPCADPIGACCYDTGFCANTIEEGCTSGTWFYASTCDEEPCSAFTGCCCSPWDGECTDELTLEECLALGYSYQGHGTICAYIENPIPTGACCIGEECVDGLTAAGCAVQGGGYLGNHTNCITDICIEGEDDPYSATNITYKPEDLWVIETAPEQYVTRVLYHIQEEITGTSINQTQSGGAVAVADFMFVIDYSNTMQTAINSVRDAVPTLAADMLTKGIDARFGLTIFGRGAEGGTPDPGTAHSCNCTVSLESEMFNGLQSTQLCYQSGQSLDGVEGGFTRNVGYLQQALNCWKVNTGRVSPYSAIQFAVNDSTFDWRDNSAKYVFFITDEDDTECKAAGCGSYTEDGALALAALTGEDGESDNILFIPAIDQSESSHVALWEALAENSGWTGGSYDVNSSDYGTLFEEVVRTIDLSLRQDNATIMERAESGIDATFLRKAELVITYDGDLSDLWTFNKTDFEFGTYTIPAPGTTTKGLSDLPFDLASGRVYGIDSVHIQGNQDLWVSFNNEGPLIYDHPDVGRRATAINEHPLLISTNSARPKVLVNNRNDVMVAYEDYTDGAPKINIKGTGDFHQNSIVGPKAERIGRLLNSSDFVYAHNITLPTEGVNQLCDMVIDNSDITHVVWQSSRDSYREIYYANSHNLFEPVRITKSESISSNPSIDVDETGSVFVVFHDNRFGPFNIMLASKDEERVIPLLEQDAYLASLREEYTHYTNILPILVDNPAVETPILGQFWASKLDSGAGNDSENFVYKLDESTGLPSDGEDQGSEHRNFLAFSSTSLYSINTSGVLTRLANIGDDHEVAFVSPETLGTIDLDIDGYHDHSIVDMAIDRFDRIWVLIYEQVTAGGAGFALAPSGLPQVKLFAQGHRFRLEYVSSFDASTIARGEAAVGDVDSDEGATFAITNDKFYFTYHNFGYYNLRESIYPTISGSEAEFSFRDIGLISAFSADPPVSMTADIEGTLWAVTTTNDLYSIDPSTRIATFQTSLTSGSGAEEALPVGATSGLVFQNRDVELTGGAQFFHVRIDFYDNLALEGEPFISVDSRDNLEAFINQEILDDPYLVDTGMDARGIYLDPGEVGAVFFDATHYVPGFSRLSQPYSFEPNQTYFPRIYAIGENESPRETTILTTYSFSCSKCSRYGNNNFNASACAYSFVVENDSFVSQYYNFQIDFYADSTKQHILRRFEATPGSPDLQYIEIDNQPATGLWGENGLPIPGEDAAFIQIYPVLDPSAGFLCGVEYTIQVNACHNAGGSECSDFSVISPNNWFASLIGSGERVHDEIADNEVMAGLSMEVINDQLSVAWKDEDQRLKFAQLGDDGEWAVQVVNARPNIMYCDLAIIAGLPTISYTLVYRTPTQTVGYSAVVAFNGESWRDWGNIFLEQDHSGALLPRTVMEIDSEPMIVYVNRGEVGNSIFKRKNGDRGTIDSDPGCHSPFTDTTGGACVITAATIRNERAIAYIAGDSVRYRTWEGEEFSGYRTVAPENAVVKGRVGLTEVDGQPAIAYLAVIGNKAQITYRRWTNNEWAKTDTRTPVADYNKHIDMTSVNDRPYIVYSIKTSPTTSQLRCTYFNGTRFIDGVIDEEINTVDPVVEIVSYRGEPAVVVSANPFKVYFFRQEPSVSVEDLRPIYFCECASKIFTDRLTHLNEVARWESSAHGFSDTLVTDSAKDSIRPSIQTRTTGATIILWEDSNCLNPPCIRAATFRNTNQDQLRGSGTKSWFDYDFGISGHNPDLTVDLYDRINSIYEQSKDPAAGTGFHGEHLSPDELPGNDLYGKICDFEVSTAGGATGQPSDACDLSSLEANVITYDPFVSLQIVRKIRIKDEFVNYYTYNASEKLTPIVSTCNIALEIHGTPEIVALRFRNEDTIVWSSWCPWSPQIGDLMMEKEHTISKGSGTKEVCIQAITYSGITTEFCLPIVADYETIVFESRFYRDTDADGNPIEGFTGFSGDDSKLVALPLSDGISVASILPEGGATECTSSSDCEENELCLNGRCVTKTATILVEIIPNQKFGNQPVSFDVIQQGSNDESGIATTKGTNDEGAVVYRGVFTVQREDNVSNIDGLARVSPAFPSACIETASFSGQPISAYTRDDLNKIATDVEVEETEVTDPLEDYRQTVSGRVGVTVDIRGSEDPYFVFGDPNYTQKKTEGRRIGVPFEVAKINLTPGVAPEEPETCEDQGIPRLTDEQCAERFGDGSTWEGHPICHCSDPVG